MGKLEGKSLGGVMIDLLRQMGLRYVLFRCWYAFQKATGILKWRFPSREMHQTFSKSAWIRCNVKFVTDGVMERLEKNPDLHALKERAERIRQNRFLYFSNRWITVTDWHSNPESGFVYDKNTHWSKIGAMSRKAGDIKYVWEKSRFCFLYDLIRYDFHFDQDQSETALALMEDWIDQNPVNRGPNWVCGQEISLRVINWTFALHYYKHAESLTDTLFEKIMNSIHQQMQHVRQNSSFSRIAVRNNHALTEALALYMTGLYFPFFQKSREWKQFGKKSFETEIAYQIYDDGTFLQFSMNYHRIVVQLLTLAMRSAELNGENWSGKLYEQAKKSLVFLNHCQDEQSGWLSNYGHNDGTLFFPLSESHYRDFRPQLASLAQCLQIDLGYENGHWQEESRWFSRNVSLGQMLPMPVREPIKSFTMGGYHIIRDRVSLTFLKCGSYQNRPFQADNLHLDIWVNGENMMRDAGTSSYNMDEKWLRYFSGTGAHNTVMLGDFDQMKKGRRFMWFNWIKKAQASLNEDNDAFVIDAKFEGFAHLGKGIVHRRRVTKFKEKLHWIIEDQMINAPAHLPMRQIWHPCPDFFEHYQIAAVDANGIKIECEDAEAWYSEAYGDKEECRQLIFSTMGGIIRTVITEKC